MPIPPNNIKDREYAKFVECPNGQTAVATCDSLTHDKLDAVVNALGGSTDTTTTIVNLSAPTANTEVSQVLPANTKQFKIRCRADARVQIAYSSGQSGTNYYTIKPGVTYINTNFYVNQTVYLQTSKNSQTIEFEIHT